MTAKDTCKDCGKPNGGIHTRSPQVGGLENNDWHRAVSEHLSYNKENGLITVVKEYFMNPIGKIIGDSHGQGYLRGSFRNRRFLIHRMAIFLADGEWPTMQIDHINHNKSDNRYKNLRQATHAENQRNVKLTIKNKTGVKGVHYDKINNKYIAQISINGKIKALGSFNTLAEAKEVRQDFAEKLHGEFVCHG